jgi:hypothetical protein
MVPQSKGGQTLEKKHVFFISLCDLQETFCN